MAKSSIVGLVVFQPICVLLISARIYRPGFHENRVYNFGHSNHVNKPLELSARIDKETTVKIKKLFMPPKSYSKYLFSIRKSFFIEYCNQNYII